MFLEIFHSCFMDTTRDIISNFHFLFGDEYDDEQMKRDCFYNEILISFIYLWMYNNCEGIKLFINWQNTSLTIIIQWWSKISKMSDCPLCLQ